MSFWSRPARQLNATVLNNALTSILVPTVSNKYYVLACRVMYDLVSKETAEERISVRRREMEISLYEMEEVSAFTNFQYFSLNTLLDIFIQLMINLLITDLFIQNKFAKNTKGRTYSYSMFVIIETEYSFKTVIQKQEKRNIYDCVGYVKNTLT